MAAAGRGTIARRSLAVALLGVLLGPLGPGVAGAAPVDVTYSISGSFYADTYGASGLDLVDGTATVRFFDPVGGTRAAQFRSMQASFFGTFTRYASESFGGDIPVTAATQALGSLSAGGLLRLPLLASGTGDLTFHYCGLASCSTVYHFRGDLLLDLVLSAPGVSIASPLLQMDGGSSDLGRFQYAVITAGYVTFTEVSRTVVPEPSTGLMLSTALLAVLGAAGGWSSHRRGRRRSRGATTFGRD